MVEDRQKQRTIFPNFSARERYRAGSNTPGSAIYKQNRWEKAGGRGAYPVLEPRTTSSIMYKNPLLNEIVGPEPQILNQMNQLPQNIPLKSDGVYPYLPHGVMKPGWLEAKGITNPNLGGAQVMNAGLFGDGDDPLGLSGSWIDPTREGGWMDRFGTWMFGDDDPELEPRYGEVPELDDTPMEPYHNPENFMMPEENNPTYDPDNPNHFNIPEGMEGLDHKDIIKMLQGERLEARTKWKDNMPLMMNSLRQRDEFKDWSDDELTKYMYRTFSNRGGLMSLI